MKRSHPTAGRPRRDGLVGLTRSERELIAGRIARVSAAKDRVGGRALLPFEIAVALEPEAAGQARKRCTRCRSKLPVGEFHWRNKARGERHAECKACMCRRSARDYAEHREERRGAKRTDAYRQASRDRCRAWRQARRAAGEPIVDTSPRGKLIKEIRSTRGEIGRARDPAAIAHYEARILNLEHEVARMDREATP